MSSGSHKDQVLRFFDAISAGDEAVLGEMLAEDARWVIPRSAPEPYAGRHRGAERIAGMMVGSIDGTFVADSVDWRPGVMVGEGDLVMAEANLRATTPDGRTYDNHYVFVAEFDPASGRIAELREHVDTRYAAGFFGG